MRRSALRIAVAFCVLLAGCSLLALSDTREDRATAALANASDALNGTDTYRFESEILVVATADGRTERIDVDASGAVDVSARKKRTDATRDGETYRSYVDNRTIYQECPQSVWEWGTEEVEGDWETQTPARRQLDLLRSGSLYYNGTDTVEDDPAILLTGEPTTDALTKYSERRANSLLGGPNVENVRVEVWLDADTYRPLESHVRFEVSESGNTATATLRTSFSDYGDPVSVTVPAQAREDPLEMGCPGS